MADEVGQLDQLLDRMEQLLSATEDFEPAIREHVFELLDGIDALHRHAVIQLAATLGDSLEPLRAADPATDWLFAAYGVGVDDLAAATEALESITPYITSHGGAVEALAVTNGVVQIKLSGSCSGCSASAQTLKEGVEKALIEGLPGFVRMEVTEDDHDATPHPPPGPTLLQIQPRPA